MFTFEFCRTGNTFYFTAINCDFFRRDVFVFMFIRVFSFHGRTKQGREGMEALGRLFG